MSTGGSALSHIVHGFRNAPPLLREAWLASPALCCLSVALRVVLAVIPVLMLDIGGLVVDALNRSVHTIVLTPTLWILISIEAGLALLSNCASRVLQHSDSLLSDHLTLHLSLKLINHCNSLDLSTFENARFQDHLQRARNQVSSEVSLLRTLFQATAQTVGVASIIITTLLLVPGLVTIQLVGVVPLALYESWYAHRRYQLLKLRTPARRWMDYVLSLVAGQTAIKEVQLFAAGSFLRDQYANYSRKHNHEDSVLSAKAAKALALLGAFSLALYYLSYVMLLRSAAEGQITLGRVLFIAGMLRSLRSQLSTTFSSVTQGLDQLLYIGDILDVFDVAPALRVDEQPQPTPVSLQLGLELRNLSFTYPECGKPSLTNISFTVSPGEVIAVVGINGSGKSTLIKLLARLYDPSEGQILLDGVDIRRYAIQDYRRLVSAVFQDHAKYDFSVSDNIALGDVAKRNDASRIQETARVIGSHEFIMTLPDKYEQLLGRRFADSVDLSGGQWQTLAITRAYMRNAQIVILDEPMAALDARTETALFEKAALLGRGKITFLVSHRLSTVRAAHRIIVLKNGYICESGTHVELMASRGEYADLFQLQARGYR